ncbi:FliK family flagellar hook-length control protein [Citrobacter freundii ATCC 8090 = MTCC 1658 = NBRC 12681]|uniref:flagellar hook length control protein FliK n=1 Tax=Citrobacter freundii TaxID=546 RepID=UPI000299C20A|nr:flagellar hook length control protein FliK [Citrobacter freundii]EKS56531.1 flagellar hook-length control protein [Citrobacter freundii ATCC 8090 = MTCC 1658 = NBRC 12681]EXF29234.1 flagellar hook-length control protein [Citrobacter freundii RLS1]KFB91662.1 FliK family flagellar hook-length control protein [Citrobacter freundii ATCC 8090 = MTCC 1658 = NBRC 12681]QIH69614.1 flagellar hook length control protein FliK [Citrobacter freundii ATCC 8090 = MTCC 1658 = NBRC 12681]WOY53376.1 flagella
MITLPQLITTDTDVAAGLQSGKAVDSPEDFLALLAGALGAGDAQGKDVPLSLADLKAAGSKLQKGLLQKNGDATPSVKLTDLLAQQELQTETSLADMTDAQQLLSALTPSLKANALTTLGKVAQQDEKNTTLSDDDLANLSALFAMLPGQPLATPAVDSAPAPVDAALSALSRGAVHGAATDNADELLPGDAKKGKADVTIAGGGANQANNPTLTPLTAAVNARAEIDSTPSPTSIGMTAAPLSGPQTHAQPLPTAAPVLSAPLGSHEWQQSLSQHVTLFTRQGQQSAELRLHPQDLGQVHISLKLDDNLAQLQMVSPHSHVRAALEAALPMLRTQLAESGIQLGQSNISSESFAGHQQSSGQQQQSGRAQGQDIFAAEDDAILATPASLQATARGDGAVDIFA